MKNPDPLRGLLAGIAAGLAAAFAMNRFQELWPTDGEGDPATVKAAQRACRAATGRSLSDDLKEPAGNALHYGLGAALGALYGLAAEYAPRVTAGFGTAFGTATALILDEVAVPAAGLAGPPWKTPAAAHAYGIVSHLVFGATAEAARRTIRAVA
ncbi:MAG: DUF1440 domain-containing protein [Sphingomonadaceae bacterium]|nr:DUF1440 domain-containing protein [Sphingomonadaceae bacterium]